MENQRTKWIVAEWDNNFKFFEEANYKEGPKREDGIYKKWYENKFLCEEHNYDTRRQ